MHTGFWWGNLRERDHLEDQGVDGRIIVRWIFRKWDWGRYGMDLSGSGYGQVADSCKRGNEILCSKNAGNFLTS